METIPSKQKLVTYFIIEYLTHSLNIPLLLLSLQFQRQTRDVSTVTHRLEMFCAVM